MRIVRTRAQWAIALVMIATFATVNPAAAQLDEKLDALEAALGSIYDGQPATLEECIRAAEVGSVTLGRFEEDVFTAAVNKRAALMQWLPNLTVDASWSKNKRTDIDQEKIEIGLAPYILADENGNPLPIESGGVPVYVPFQQGTGVFEDVTIDQTFSSQTVRSNWTIFSGFDRIAERNQAGSNYDASVATLDYQRDVLRETVTNRYFDYIRAQQRVQVALDAQELAARELERSETYFELGISTRSDVLQAKVRHQQTKLDVVRERNGERNSFLGLAHSMNIPGARPFQVESSLPAASGIEIPEVEALLATARQNRLDLVATQFVLDASQSGVTRSRSAYYPNVSAFASFGHSKSETPFRFGAQENTSLNYGIQGSWSIFDRFRTKQSVRSAVASRRRAEYDFRQKQLDVELEVVNLWNNLTESIESYHVSVVSVEQSQEDLRLAEERFRVGAGTALDVITAQVNLAQARRDLVDAQINAIKFDSQLDRATGVSIGR